MPGFYMTVANGGQEHRDQFIARTRQFLSIMDELAKEKNGRGQQTERAKKAKTHAQTIRNGWVAIGGGRIFTISRSDPEDEKSYNPWYGPYAWNDIAHVEVIPVITVGHLMQLLDKENPLKLKTTRSPRR